MARTFDPFHEFDRMFNSTMRAGSTSPAMTMDLYRKGDDFVALIDLPGVDPESIDIDIDDRTLTIRAERTAVEDPEIEWLTHERPSGTFARQLTLGAGMALDRISAKYTDGVLTLTMPIAEESKPRKIAVSHESKVIDAADAE